MVLLLFLLLPRAFAHTGRPTHQNSPLTQVLLAAGLLVGGWMRVHFSSQRCTLPRKDVPTNGHLPSIIVQVLPAEHHAALQKGQP